MDLIAELALHNLKIADISRLYVGKNHWCRCGCGGNYHEKDTPGFKRAISRLMKPETVPLSTADDSIDFRMGTQEAYMNIPLANRTNRCICLYFDMKEVKHAQI